MWESFRVIIQHFSGTLTLILIDTLSFCVALRIFMNESLKIESDINMMYIAGFLTLVSLISTIKLMSSSKTPIMLYDYAKLEGFEDEEDIEGENLEENSEFYEYDSEESEEIIVVEEINEEVIHTDSDKKYNDDILDVNINFDDSDSIKGFESSYKSSGRVTLD